MPGLNYDKWANLNSDSDDEDATLLPDLKAKRPVSARSSKPAVSSAPDLTLAQRRKADADNVFNAVLGRRLDLETRGGFAEAIRLYEGALAALDSPSGVAAADGPALKLSCHMNVAAASIQLGAWAGQTNFFVA